MNMHRKIFSLTNLMPLFTTSYEKNNSEYSKGVLEYLKRNNIIDSDNSPQYFSKCLLNNFAYKILTRSAK